MLSFTRLVSNELGAERYLISPEFCWWQCWPIFESISGFILVTSWEYFTAWVYTMLILSSQLPENNHILTLSNSFPSLKFFSLEIEKHPKEKEKKRSHLYVSFVFLSWKICTWLCNYLAHWDGLENSRPKFQRAMKILSPTKFKAAESDRSQKKKKKCHSCRMRNIISCYNLSWILFVP